MWIIPTKEDTHRSTPLRSRRKVMLKQNVTHSGAVRREQYCYKTRSIPDWHLLLHCQDFRKRGNLLQIFLKSPAVRMFLNLRMDRPVLSSQMMKRGIFTIFHFYPFLHTQGFTVCVAIFHFSLSYRYLKSKVWAGQFLGLLVTVYFSKYSVPLKISLFRNMFSSAAVCGIQFPAVSFTRHRFFI